MKTLFELIATTVLEVVAAAIPIIVIGLGLIIVLILLNL